MTDFNITSFPLAMKDYFGLLPGKQIADFMAELKALTPEDKAEYRAMLQKIGYKLP